MIELLPNRLLTSFWEGGGAPKMFPRIPTNWFLGPFYRVTAFYHWSYAGRNVRPMDVEKYSKMGFTAVHVLQYLYVLQ